MAATLTEWYRSFFTFVNEGFKYNLQVFPDTMTAAILLFGLLTQSPSLASMGASIVAMNLFQPGFGKLLANVVSDTASASSDVNKCSGRFPGVSYERLLSLSRERGFGALNYTGFPSHYMMLLGFLLAYVSWMKLIYQKELSASPKRDALTTTGIVVMVLLVIVGIIYRYSTGCDSIMSIFLGTLSGFLFGSAAVGIIAWASDRRFTNILGFPLIRDKAKSGRPIYVCERTPAQA